LFGLASSGTSGFKGTKATPMLLQQLSKGVKDAKDKYGLEK
jgi:hypothetical protein